MSRNIQTNNCFNNQFTLFSKWKTEQKIKLKLCVINYLHIK